MPPCHVQKAGASAGSEPALWPCLRGCGTMSSLGCRLHAQPGRQQHHCVRRHLRLPCAAAQATARDSPPTPVLRLLPRQQPPAGQRRRSTGAGVRDPSADARAVLKHCRRWEDVLGQAALHLNDEGWGPGAAVEAVCRCARTVSLFDSRVQSKARSARARAESVRRDARYAAISAVVLAAVPQLDLHRMVRGTLCVSCVASWC